jgi:ribonuclease HI
MLQMHFCASNNIAEYEALVHGLKMAKQISIRRIASSGRQSLCVVNNQPVGNPKRKV